MLMRYLLKAFGACLAASWAVPPAMAGGYAPCDSPFIFPSTAANVVPVEFQAVASGAIDAEGRRRLTDTARRLAWLFKLDAWHQPTYGDIGIVSHFFVNEPCDERQITERLLQGGAFDPVREGQVLVLLTGSIFQEGGEIYLQSRIVGFRRSSIPFHNDGELRHYVQPEVLISGAGASPGDYYRASWPDIEVTFSPRHLTSDFINNIDSRFADASRLYSQANAVGPSESLEFDAENARAFSVTVTEGEWLYVEDYFGGQKGYIRSDPEASNEFHSAMPELDFLNGVVGVLRLEQARANPQFAPITDGSAATAIAAFDRYLERTNDSFEYDAQAKAHALAGIAAANAMEDWDTARRHHRAAAELAPADAKYRNLLGVSDAARCCSLQEGEEFRDPTQWFADSLSLAPTYEEPLENLRVVLEYINSLSSPPDWLPVAELDRRLSAIRGITGVDDQDQEDEPGQEFVCEDFLGMGNAQQVVALAEIASQMSGNTLTAEEILQRLTADCASQPDVLVVDVIKEMN